MFTSSRRLTNPTNHPKTKTLTAPKIDLTPKGNIGKKLHLNSLHKLQVMKLDCKIEIFLNVMKKKSLLILSTSFFKGRSAGNLDMNFNKRGGGGGGKKKQKNNKRGDVYLAP